MACVNQSAIKIIENCINPNILEMVRMPMQLELNFIYVIQNRWIYVMQHDK